MKSRLTINQLVLKLHIGVEELERLNTQEIECNLDLCFSNPPLACQSSNIQDAVCYADLVEVINEFCLGKEFILIEELCFSMHQHLKKHLPDNVKLKLQICKRPPLDQIRGHCCFTIED
jgi:FolB domain-containing protein